MAAKFRTMLGTQGFLVGRDLYCATPPVARYLGFSSFPHLIAYYDTRRDAEDLSSRLRAVKYMSIYSKMSQSSEMQYSSKYPTTRMLIYVHVIINWIF
jgi:hypothetical protein